jgi:hypothetical protein
MVLFEFWIFRDKNLIRTNKFIFSLTVNRRVIILVWMAIEHVSLQLHTSHPVNLSCNTNKMFLFNITLTGYFIWFLVETEARENTVLTSVFIRKKNLWLTLWFLVFFRYDTLIYDAISEFLCNKQCINYCCFTIIPSDTLCIRQVVAKYRFI